MRLKYSGYRTRIVCVQVRTRPIHDGLDAVLREINLAVLIGNFQTDLMAA